MLSGNKLMGTFSWICLIFALRPEVSPGPTVIRSIRKEKADQVKRIRVCACDAMSGLRENPSCLSMLAGKGGGKANTKFASYRLSSASILCWLPL